MKKRLPEDAAVLNFPNGKTRLSFADRLGNLSRFAKPSETFVIADKRALDIRADGLRPFRVIVVPEGEKAKSLRELERLIGKLAEMKAGKDSTLVAFGGGATSDLCGLAASIYMRGVRFGLVPTTLLAQVDACIGGKNGVNAAGVKNLAGTIAQPDFVLYDHKLLLTLDAVDWSNGFAEMIKLAALMDGAMFSELEKIGVDGAKRCGPKLYELIRKSALRKAGLVMEDINDKGRRRLLNFGHTVGHALELGKGLPHGQAVSIGMSVEARWSVAHGFLREDDLQRLCSLLSRFHLPVRMPRSGARRVIDSMALDKKRTGAMIALPVLSGIGRSSMKDLPIADFMKFVTQ